MITGTSGASARMLGSASRPLRPGRRISRRTRRDALVAGGFRVNGHDDHLDPRVEDEDPSPRLEAAKSRRSEIEHPSIGTLTLHLPEGFETIDRLDDLEPLPTQERGDHLVNLRLVGHHEDPWAAGRIRRTHGCVGEVSGDGLASPA